MTYRLTLPQYLQRYAFPELVMCVLKLKGMYSYNKACLSISMEFLWVSAMKTPRGEIILNETNYISLRGIDFGLLRLRNQGMNMVIKM